MGGRWDNSKPITVSIAPDGVAWDRGTNNLNATLDAEFGGTSWQGLLADALQTWSAATGLNFTMVPDGKYAFNTPGAAQGDPRFGDIRIGGSNFGSTATIAQTYGPPTNGQTSAGDVDLNTGINFGSGSRYDLETVLIHEIGHALGLGESPQPASVMYTYYLGTRTALSSYDVEGIQSLYGARTPDRFQSGGVATSASNAFNITPYLNASRQTQVGGVGLSTIGDVEYFSVVSPSTVGATLKVAAQANGYSLLSPEIRLIDPTTGQTLATAGTPSQHGDLALTSIPDVQSGHRYLIAVTGATGDEFAVGAYAVQVGFFGGTPVGINSATTPAAATNALTPSTPTPSTVSLPGPSNLDATPAIAIPRPSFAFGKPTSPAQ